VKFATPTVKPIQRNGRQVIVQRMRIGNSTAHAYAAYEPANWCGIHKMITTFSRHGHPGLWGRIVSRLPDCSVLDALPEEAQPGYVDVHQNALEEEEQACAVMAFPEAADADWHDGMLVL